jgi:hypothetical protein
MLKTRLITTFVALLVLALGWIAGVQLASAPSPSVHPSVHETLPRG